MITAIVTAAACFVAGVALYPALLTVLVRLGAGQMVQEYNPQNHQVKAGTPTMGGLLFGLIAVAAWLAVDRSRAGFVIAYALVGGAAVGFLDDLANVRGLGSLGLAVRQKLVLQVVVGVAVGFGLHQIGATLQNLPGLGLLDLGWGIVPLAALAVVATTNAVNVTDGVDGLAGSCTAIALVGAVVAGVWLHAPAAVLMGAALLGGVAAFLLYNWHPARIFMGDTGALGLGAALTAIAVEAHLLWLLPLLGIVFAVETASVIINVTAITRFQRRLFQASPIHHHFEKLGIREEHLVLLFAGAGAVALALTLLVAHGVAAAPVP
ncbi:MAG TPA: phospho-N-acetylmuramoyl-pentapeptide-transferase [Candidatus Binatia bacterium]|nr:phospho-N-acetylmuramoyl-pentapeptide-transferase [Candidatus Binatia bacterium]